jgi:pyridoxine 4-dehydrogenase
MKRHSMPQVRTRLLEGAWSYAGKENCNFSQCKCSPCGRKGRSKLTGYACPSLDDRRRPQDFVSPRLQTSKKCHIKQVISENAERLRCGSDKMELRVKQSSYKGAALAGTIDLGDLTVNRLGFGAMRLCGDYAWGRPRDREHVNRVLRRAVELGVNFIDTADSYGPETNESLISQALYPYPPGLVIATKGGLVRPNRGSWVEDGRPDHLRRAIEGSLGRLRLERIDLYQLHAPDPNVPFVESVGALADLQRLGKIRHIGISNVTVAQLEVARSITPIVSVQNMYNLRNRSSEDVLAACERLGIAFLPWFPLGGKRGLKALRIKQVASRYGLTHAALSLAWLLAKSPVMLPIPGTRSIDHLEDNVLAAALKLEPEDFDDLG